MAKSHTSKRKHDRNTPKKVLQPSKVLPETPSRFGQSKADRYKSISRSSKDDYEASTIQARKRQKRSDRPISSELISTISRLGRQQAVELAITHYDGYKKSRRRTPYSALRELAKQKWGVSPSDITIGRWIGRAFRERWVEVVPAAENAPPAKYRLDLGLAQALKEKFKGVGLQDAMVLDIKEPPDSHVARPDDPFYQALGIVMAEYLATKFIKPKNVVGIGSGRACYNAVKFLENYGPLNISGLKLMALTGRVWSRPDPAQRMASWMDSDYHLALFLNHCTSAQPFYIGHPLTYPAMYIASKPQDTVTLDVLIEEARKNTWLGSEHWKELHPNVAILGCGTVLKDHRFWVGRDTVGKKAFDPLLQPVYEDLKKLVGLFEDQLAPGEKYSPVSDTSNHLFFTPHPDGAVRKKFKEDEIRDAIGVINKKLLSITDAQFPDIDAIALIAGSAEKAFAIRELLQNHTYNITVLCTDRAAAAKLIEMPV